MALQALQTAKSSWHTKGLTKAGLLFQLRHAGAPWRTLIRRAAAYRLPSIRHTILRLFRSACLLLNSVSNSVSLKKVASGISSIAGGGFAWTVYFIQPLRLLMVRTVRTTGYMKTSAAVSQSKKLWHSALLLALCSASVCPVRDVFRYEKRHPCGCLGSTGGWGGIRTRGALRGSPS